MTVAVGMPPASAAPSSDSQGYVDSTARCASPDTAVVFGSTDSSRVAICKTAAGSYQYRGVRVRDGAKLILPASASGDGTYVADNDGVTYSVSSSALVVKAGSKVFRTESMVDFHGSPSARAATGTPAPSAPPKTPATPTPTTPLPPPLPAEVGGSGNR
jgi:hypothetical protein